MKQCAIIIPIYRKLTELESVSMKQALNVLGDWDIFGVIPEKSMFLDTLDRKIEFPKEYFESVDSYNRLMLSEAFYERFANYEYILVYQLDAFVFTDQLSYFCQLGYDYIGAPWLHGVYNYVDEKHCIWHVGNGGLSLRRVQSFINVIRVHKEEINCYTKNEDLFFSSIVSKEFKIAPIEIALEFSFEREVEKCYEKNGHRLPFGCHAWWRYQYDFWKKHIEAQGYCLPEVREGEGNEDVLRGEHYYRLERFSDFWRNEYHGDIAKSQLDRFFNNEKGEYAIFGAGFYGRAINKWFKDIGITIKCFFDNDVSLSGTIIEGCLVENAKKLEFEKQSAKILISSFDYSNQIEKQLSEMGYEKGKDFISYIDIVDILKGQR